MTLYICVSIRKVNCLINTTNHFARNQFENTQLKFNNIFKAIDVITPAIPIP